MRTEEVDALILGAGPAGLAAGYTLAKAGLKPVVLEKDKVSGGLMRSIKRGDFALDIGRKELYNRLTKVDQFWTDLLGAEYRPYSHRGGVLYDGLIFDQSPTYQGFRRGMPLGLFLGCLWDFGWAQISRRRNKPRNIEEYFYQTRGRRLTQVVSQGFQEKLIGRKWSEMPLPETQDRTANPGIFETLKGAWVRTFSAREVNTFKGIWRHPSRGTGQICEALEKGLLEKGGAVHHNVRLMEIASGDGKVQSVTAQIGAETVQFRAKNVISSVPLEFIVQLLLNKRVEPPPEADKSSPFRKKTVVLVYLFLDETPRFPQAWLIVTCPKTRIGRITNYSGFGGKMVPEGKTGLCCEYYCFDEDPLLQLTDEQLAEMARAECAKFDLIDSSKCFDTLVLRFPGADASQNRHNWLSKIRMGLLQDLKPFRNFYYINRTDLDIATLAGIEAGEAILSGDRTEFDRHIDPTQIGIRSERKAFEFKNPVSS